MRTFAPDPAAARVNGGEAAAGQPAEGRRAAGRQRQRVRRALQGRQGPHRRRGVLPPPAHRPQPHPGGPARTCRGDGPFPMPLPSPGITLMPQSLLGSRLGGCQRACRLEVATVQGRCGDCLPQFLCDSLSFPQFPQFFPCNSLQFLAIPANFPQLFFALVSCEKHQKSITFMWLAHISLLLCDNFKFFFRLECQKIFFLITENAHFGTSFFLAKQKRISVPGKRLQIPKSSSVIHLLVFNHNTNCSKTSNNFLQLSCSSFAFLPKASNPPF